MPDKKDELKEEKLEEKETTSKEEVKEESGKKDKKLKKVIEDLEENIKKLNGEIAHWKNEYYRAYADMKNLRNNLEKDHKESMKYRAEGFIEELLPVLDSFHMALANEPTDPALKNYLIGFQFIYKNMVAALENEGVTEISPKVGDKFDSNTMNGVDTVEGEKENLVTKVYGNGYKLHDRLIRPANVQVSTVKKEEEKSEETKEENKDNKADA